MASADVDQYRCFAGGLSFQTTEIGLRNAFSEHGEVTDCKIINDRETGRSRGFGFITFLKEESMRNAIEALNGQQLDGRNITVNEAQAQTRGNGGGGGRREGGYGRGGGGYGRGGRYNSNGYNNGGYGESGGYGGGESGGYGGNGSRGYGGGNGSRGYGSGESRGYRSDSRGNSNGGGASDGSDWRK